MAQPDWEANPSAEALESAEEPSHLASGGRFILHHMLAWRGHFAALLLLVVTSAACGVGQQYGLKLLVDAIAGPPSLSGAVLFASACSSSSSPLRRPWRALPGGSLAARPSASASICASSCSSISNVNRCAPCGWSALGYGLRASDVPPSLWSGVSASFPVV
ncbi:hypothetical protein AFFFEF_00295 [Methylorubrum extorquens]